MLLNIRGLKSDYLKESRRHQVDAFEIICINPTNTHSISLNQPKDLPEVPDTLSLIRVHLSFVTAVMKGMDKEKKSNVATSYSLYVNRSFTSFRMTQQNREMRNFRQELHPNILKHSKSEVLPF